MSFDKIFDLKAGVYFNFYNITTAATHPRGSSPSWSSLLLLRPFPPEEHATLISSRGERGDDSSGDAELAVGDPPEPPPLVAAADDSPALFPPALETGVGRSMPPVAARGAGLPASLPLALQRGVFGRESVLLLLLLIPLLPLPGLCLVLVLVFGVPPVTLGAVVAVVVVVVVVEV